MTTAVMAGLTLDEFIDGNYEHAEFFGGEVRPKPLAGLKHARMEAELAMVSSGCSEKIVWRPR